MADWGINFRKTKLFEKMKIVEKPKLATFFFRITFERFATDPRCPHNDKTRQFVISYIFLKSLSFD